MPTQSKAGWGALYDIQEKKKREREETPKQGSSTLVPDHSSTRPELPEPNHPQEITSDPQDSSTLVPDHQSTLVPESRYYRKPNSAADSLDRMLSPAESKVYEHLWRMTAGFGRDKIQMRVSTLCKRTGYRSMKTVRVALFGLESKGLIKKIGRNNDPLGDEYVMLDSGTGVLESSSTSVESSQVLKSKITRQLNTSLKNKEQIDDEGFAPLRDAAQEITGKVTDPRQWRELAEILAAELKIAAGRTTISSAPAFLAEHLRRRLFKKDKRQIEREVVSPGAAKEPALTKEQIDTCLDCFGTGMWYPEGYEKGVAKCRHEKLVMSRTE